MNRRGFLSSILAAGIAPAAIGSGVLMPVRKIWTPENNLLKAEMIIQEALITLEAGDIFTISGLTQKNGQLRRFVVQETYFDRSLVIKPFTA